MIFGRFLVCKRNRCDTNAPLKRPKAPNRSRAEGRLIPHPLHWTGPQPKTTRCRPQAGRRPFDILNITSEGCAPLEGAVGGAAAARARWGGKIPMSRRRPGRTRTQTPSSRRTRRARTSCAASGEASSPTRLSWRVVRTFLSHPQIVPLLPQCLLRWTDVWEAHACTCGGGLSAQRAPSLLLSPSGGQQRGHDSLLRASSRLNTCSPLQPPR